MARKSDASAVRRNEGGISGAEKASVETGEESGAGNGTGAETGAGNDSAAGTGAETGAGKEAKPLHNSVKPTEIAPDNYARDENGNIIYKADGTPAKKRGRKKGQAANSPVNNGAPKKKSGDTAVAVEMLAAQFQVLNTCIAYITSFEDFKLDDSEAMQMAQASANVMEQFDYTPDPKIAAVLGLVTTTSLIYGPRMYLYRSHLKKLREEKSKQRQDAFDARAAQGQDFSYPSNMGQFSG